MSVLRSPWRVLPPVRVIVGASVCGLARAVCVRVCVRVCVCVCMCVCTSIVERLRVIRVCVCVGARSCKVVSLVRNQGGWLCTFGHAKTADAVNYR